MKLVKFTIGNLEKNFLEKRNKIMRTSRADLVMLLNTDIEAENYQHSIELFKKDPKLFAVHSRRNQVKQSKLKRRPMPTAALRFIHAKYGMKSEA